MAADSNTIAPASSRVANLKRKKSNLGDSLIHIENQDALEMTSFFRIAITDTTGQILKNHLQLLGIEAPEKMLSLLWK